MPIVYETPAPVAAAASVAEQAARQRADQLAAAASGGGRGLGGFAGIPYDTGIQDAIAFRDNRQFQTQQASAQLHTQPDAQRAQFSLQAQLEETRLAQQERIRLQRLQNSLGQVASDPNLSADEKSEIVSQLKYQISPLQMRLAKEKVEQERIVKEGLVEQRRAQAALEEERLKVHTAKFEDRMHYFVPPDVLNEIAAAYRDNMPNAELLPPAVIEGLARAEAMKQKLGVPVFQQEPGKWVGADNLGGAAFGSPAEAAAGGKGKGSRSGGGSDHELGISPQEYLKAREHVEQQVMREAAMTVTDDLNNKKPRYPELATSEGQQKRVDELLGRAGLPKNFGEYAEGRKPQPTRGFVNPFKKPEAAPVAAAAKPPEPFEFDKPTNEAQKSLVSSWKGFDEKAANLPPDQRREAANILSELKGLISQSGSPDRLPPAELKKYRDLVTRIDQLTSAPRPQPAGAAPAASAPAVPPARPWWQKALSGFVPGNAGGGGGY